MAYVASIDIGTTAAKGVLVDREANIHHEVTIALRTQQDNGFMEQNPSDWWEAVLQIAAHWRREGISGSQIACISMSGQMQDLIAIDEQGEALRPAILYSDARAGAEAERITETVGLERIREVTGNHFDGTFPLAKLLWLKEHEPQVYEQTAKVLFGSKDFIVHRLTGRAVTDPTTASTSGVLHASKRVWASEWMRPSGLAERMLPEIVASHERAGTVTAEAARLTGWSEGTPVVAGVGDAGATTLGAGVTNEADVYSYLGTTGWLAVSTPAYTYREGGVFHLAHPADGLYIAIAPLLNVGNVHQWAVQTFAPDGGTEADRYAAFERLASSADRGRSPVVFLPYLNGERCPVQDPDASGAFIGMRADTTKAELSAAVLEGVAFALRHVKDYLLPGRQLTEAALIGGGSQSRLWRQIISDVLACPLRVPESAQYLPALGAAACAFIHLGWIESYDDFKQRYLLRSSTSGCLPELERSTAYERKFAQYVRLYPLLKQL
ncbi:xylulokinase [Paenibacillus rigui]|uniref:Carbohydrate kinase n=1 Tax=Paenibacillus rigui TaxID=554312 RepID=A0A229UUI9_9BACL|nr:FGGY family carbohydrate kinase [Paenibacillus rigui]OXM86579.1 hypothetical protein CF651_08990 [Paenibacillus rigui]